ncbi:MAG: hypothetical protein ACUVYA_13095, partial [Planctomycetota bacterium]
MRRVSPCVAALLAAALSLAEPEGPRRGPAIAWDQSASDESGAPLELEAAEIALTGPAGDLRKGEAALAKARAPIRAGENSADLGALFPGVPPGSYRVWVRAVDKKGAASAWSGPLPVEFGAPERPPEDTAPPPSAPEASKKEPPPKSAPEGTAHPASSETPPPREPLRPHASSDPRCGPWQRGSL